MECTQFQGAALISTDLSQAKLSRADFSNAELSFAKLNGANAYRTNFSNAYRTNFSNAFLWHTQLRNAKLVQADLTNAILPLADVFDADLSQTKLIGADITYTLPWTSVLFQDQTSIRRKGLDSLKEVERKEIKSVDNLMCLRQILKNSYESDECEFYFRGQCASSWELLPSVMRSQGTAFRDNESEMLLDLMSRKPENFVGVTSALSQLVLAQHHGLKTRLLDITRNPLVALFYACENSSPRGKFDNGLFHVFVVPKSLVKTFDSDTISIIANFAKLPRSEQDVLMGKSEDPNFKVGRRSQLGYSNHYNYIMNRLYHYIRQEKPYFNENINIRDLFRVFVVEPKQSFERIRMQSGAFLISAFHERFEKEKILAWNKNIPVYDHYKLVVPIDNKGNILKELRFLNVKREVLTPSLDETAKAIVEKYQNT